MSAFCTRFMVYLVPALFFFIPKAFAESETKPTLETFYQSPLLQKLSLSPDGSKLVALRNVGQETFVQIIDLNTDKSILLSKTDNIKFRYAWVEWANNSHLLVSLRFTAVRAGGIRTNETRLYSLEAKEGAELVQMAKDRRDARFTSQFQDNVIKLRYPDDNHFLLSIDRDLQGHDSVYQVHVQTGEMRLLQQAQRSVRNWLVDRQGEVRVGFGFKAGNAEHSIRIKPPGKEQWLTAWKNTVLDEPGMAVLGFGKEAKDLYVAADHQGRTALYKVDLSKADFPKELVLSDEKYDVSGSLIYSRAKQDVVGIYFNSDASRSMFWDPEFKAFQAGLDRTLPDSHNYVVSFSDNARRYIVYSSSVTEPGTYYYGDRDEKTLVPLVSILPGLDDTILVAKSRVEYKSRDGLAIEGYISTPKGKSGPLPMVVLPHGGPMSQDSNSFDRFSAYLVNKGYLVFQPNFRGSSGYGRDFMIQAMGQYGMAMQDDITDGVNYLVQQQLADPKKICIMGASYGGYAALLGVAKTPDLYQCAISFAGISDLEELRGSYRHFVNYQVVRKQIGTDNKQLEKSSPLYLVNQIKVPVLLIHGDEDLSVPVKQSREMVEALKKSGKVYQYIELEDGSHHLDYLPHRQKTFEVIDEFLNTYLPL
ncbi:alpha/beta hydrolase family protein [Rheinheimera soli]|uniref:alpha/beta hydrolase family protein n=1 Tax=Rheinheimera soli TaxID=443616 RepID=UPI001E577D60|nr:S9 family peptidase [Rheinheimera soli]